jgi:hypothetical protein
VGKAQTTAWGMTKIPEFVEDYSTIIIPYPLWKEQAKYMKK